MANSYQIAVLGDKDSVMGFKALGLTVFPVDDVEQARIDSGEQKIIGVNEYRLEKEAPIDILAVDNTAVRESQVKRLKELRANRDEAAVKRALGDDQAGCPARTGRGGCESARHAGRDFRRMRGGRRSLQSSYPFHFRSLQFSREKR